jgi:hypothetical protein
VISAELARRLRDAGLEWLPREGDRFMIPDRDLEDHVFSISDMTIEARKLRGGMRISFNGAVEWALDSIMQREVVWLPSEAQLRNRLGHAFDSLHRDENGYRCLVTAAGQQRIYEAADPADAYAAALLDLLGDPETMLRLIVDEPG